MKKILSDEAVINHLELFQAECEKKRIYPSGDIEKIKEHDELQSMAAFNWREEEPKCLCHYYFDDRELEIEVKEFFIKVFDEIKYDRDEIPVELKRFAFKSILYGFEKYWENSCEINIDDLKDRTEFTLDSIEWLISYVAHYDEFEQYFIKKRKIIEKYRKSEDERLKNLKAA